jgi:hypothetical protein
VAFQEHNLHPNIIIILLDQSDGQIQHLKIKDSGSTINIQDLVALFLHGALKYFQNKPEIAP